MLMMTPARAGWFFLLLFLLLLVLLLVLVLLLLLLLLLLRSYDHALDPESGSVDEVGGCHQVFFGAPKLASLFPGGNSTSALYTKSKIGKLPRLSLCHKQYIYIFMPKMCTHYFMLSK